MKRQSTQSQWTLEAYESAFTPVSPHSRKSTSSIFIVTMGYAAALSCFVIGAKVGYALPFWQATWACIIGNVILMGIGIFMGIMAFESGWSTTFLVRKMFGKRASILVSLLVILLSVYWVGMNGDSFARMLVTAFPRWPVPVAVTAVILVVLWGLSSAYGWRGLTITSWILAPLTILFAVSILGLIDTQVNIRQAVQSFKPTGSLTMTTAIAAVTGNYIFGCTISPDLCRFAKSRKAVVQAIIPSYTIGFILLNLCGVLIAQIGKAADFGSGVAKLGFAIPYTICAAMGLWTTENYNMYVGSLAAQNLFLGTPVEGNLSHRVATWILVGLSATFAALKAANYLMPIIVLISSLVPPIAGMLFVEFFVFRRGKQQPSPCSRHWVWALAWSVGGIVGIWSYYEKFLISPINALVASAVVYLILRLCAGQKSGKAKAVEATEAKEENAI